MKKSKIELAGLFSSIFGICSIISIPLWYVSLVLAVLSLILGTKAIKAYGSTAGKVAIILSIIGLTLLIQIYGLIFLSIELQ